MAGHITFDEACANLNTSSVMGANRRGFVVLASRLEVCPMADGQRGSQGQAGLNQPLSADTVSSH